jgi:predicted metal-binding protein
MKYIDLALELGAKNAVRFEIADIVFDPRVILKCIFGCGSFGRNHTCPFQKSPLTMKEYEETLKRYQWGVIVGCTDKNESQRVSLEIERRAFLDGYYFAFSLADCGLCKECAKVTEEPCRIPAKARPAFHSVGIDVFKTVKKFNLPLYVAQDYDAELNWYSAVFIE